MYGKLFYNNTMGNFHLFSNHQIFKQIMSLMSITAA